MGGEEVRGRAFAKKFCQCTYTLTTWRYRCGASCLAKLCECRSCPNEAPPEPGTLVLAAACIHPLARCSTSDSSWVQITHPDSWFWRLTHQSEHPGFAAVVRELLLAPDHTWNILKGLAWGAGLARGWPGGVLWDAQVRADKADGGRRTTEMCVASPGFFCRFLLRGRLWASLDDRAPVILKCSVPQINRDKDLRSYFPLCHLHFSSHIQHLHTVEMKTLATKSEPIKQQKKAYRIQLFLCASHQLVVCLKE